MILIRAAIAFLNAATAFMSVAFPIIESRKIIREIEKYEDEIRTLGLAGDPVSKLLLETASRRKARAIEQLGALRSANGNTDQGPDLPL